MPGVKRTYTGLLSPNDGGDPRIVVVLEEDEHGWLCQQLVELAGNWDAPREKFYLQKSHWKRTEYYFSNNKKETGDGPAEPADD